jgi:hypothetical protein
MQGEIFEEMIESLTLQAQEEELSKLKWNIKKYLAQVLKYWN